MATRTKYELTKDLEADKHENEVYRNGRNGRTNNGRSNNNGHYGQLGKDFNEESDKVNRCLRITNPIILGLAIAIMFTTVFCILYYGIINGKGLLNPWAKELIEVPVNSTAEAMYTCDPPCDVANSFCGDAGQCLCEQDYSPMYSETDAERLIKCVVSKMMTPPADNL